jgi:hypothetical protein
MIMPTHSRTAGSVILEEAFALGKMNDRSGWNGLLRDKITPSDVDLCFDNDGAIIFIDFSNTFMRWDDLDKMLHGQRWFYESAIKHGPHCAVLCKHSVAPEMGRKIDTLRDVEYFQVMVWDSKPVMSPVYDGTRWQAFVMLWVNNLDGPLKIRRHILGTSIGMVKPEKGPPTDCTMGN